MDNKALIQWLDDQSAIAKGEAKRTTDKITAAYWIGRAEAFEKVQLQVTLEAWKATDGVGRRR